MRQDLYNMSRAELAAWLTDRGHSRFRADQVFAWAHGRLACSFDEMTDLPAALRAALAGEFTVGPLEPLSALASADSTKLLLGLSDGETVECVRMATGAQAASLCLSSQVGCAIRCAFCASGVDGLVRSLTAGEIVTQAITLRARVGPARNVVFMGMGEPMHSLDSVLKALSILTDKGGWGISPQRITVATSGVAEGIRRYAREGPATELALSLNAPSDELRGRLMPGVCDSLEDVLGACDVFCAAHGGQPVTYAYVLLAGLNEQPGHANELVRLLSERRHHLNLIPYNPVVGLPYQRPSKRSVEAFRARLAEAGLNVTVRRSRGDDIAAACGQLRAQRGSS